MKEIIDNKLVELVALQASSKRGNTWKKELESILGITQDHELFLLKKNGALFAMKRVMPISDDAIVCQNMYNQYVSKLNRKIDNMMWQMERHIVS